MSSYDLDRAVAEFRRAITLRDEAPTAAQRNKHDAEAKRLRNVYKAWNGDDELAEVALGEPFDHGGHATP